MFKIKNNKNNENKKEYIDSKCDADSFTKNEITKNEITKNEITKNDSHSFTEETIYDIIIYLFILVGFLYIWKEKRVPEKYGVIVGFCMFKILTNYRKCTFSRLECKLRKVKREEGVLASYLDRMVDLRYSKYKYIIYVASAILILHTENLKEKTINFFPFFKKSEKMN